MRARRSSRWICANSTARRANVTAFFLHVLPRLRPGVMVHLHDMPCRAALPIFTDEDFKRRPAQWPRRPHASMRATIAPISRDDSLSFLQASGRAPRQAARCFHATPEASGAGGSAGRAWCWPRVVLTEKRRALRTPIPNSCITARDLSDHLVGGTELKTPAFEPGFSTKFRSFKPTILLQQSRPTQRPAR